MFYGIGGGVSNKFIINSRPLTAVGPGELPNNVITILWPVYSPLLQWLFQICPILLKSLACPASTLTLSSTITPKLMAEKITCLLELLLFPTPLCTTHIPSPSFCRSTGGAWPWETGLDSCHLPRFSFLYATPWPPLFLHDIPSKWKMLPGPTCTQFHASSSLSTFLEG